MTFEQELYQKEQLKLIETQQQIQNLIQASTFDFNQNLDHLDLSHPNSIEFNYVTGHVNIEYELISDHIVQLKFMIEVDGLNKPFVTHTKIHV
ncbi:hypothetical protein [Aquisalibacillus elongatus]|nr:hypothetical protein [Aquisalibacillus elongatus]